MDTEKLMKELEGALESWIDKEKRKKAKENELENEGHSSALPVMKEVEKKAKKKGVELVLMSTPNAILNINEKDTNLILHLTC